MNKSVFTLTLEILFTFQVMSQPGNGNSFKIYKNLKYTEEKGSSFKLDIYIPGGMSRSGGIGVAGKETNQLPVNNTQSAIFPVILWLPENGAEIFPTPIAAFVGNGYVVVSLQYGDDSMKLKNITQALTYLSNNKEKFNISTENPGIVEPDENGYIASVFNKGDKKLKSISHLINKVKISAPMDSNFDILQSPESRTILLGFFDKHLRNGIHKESDPLTLDCPADSWADPITNTIPGTFYKLFPTLVRGKEKLGSYLIYLPEGYSSSNKRYPVIYWLHGGNGNSRQGAWMCDQMRIAMQSGEMTKAIIVFVQGLPIGWYNNSKDGTMPIEDVIIKDLIPHIDATYRTISSREARGIDGISMGGYGSLHLGFKYPELFGVVSSIAPSITTYEMERKEVLESTFGDDAGYFNANSPANLLQKNLEYIRGKTIIRLLVGDKDFLLDLVQKFHEQLNSLQIKHQYAIAKDADHDYKEVIKMLNFNSFTFWGEAFNSYK